MHNASGAPARRQRRQVLGLLSAIFTLAAVGSNGAMNSYLLKKLPVARFTVSVEELDLVQLSWSQRLYRLAAAAGASSKQRSLHVICH